MMEQQQGEVRPEESIVKRSIEELVQAYTDVKSVFFLNASKEDDTEAEGRAVESYTVLINILHGLLELCKPDNLERLEEIIGYQRQLEALDNQNNLTTNEAEYLRDLCAWADTTILRPHLKTQPNIARCISHTLPTVY